MDTHAGTLETREAHGGEKYFTKFLLTVFGAAEHRPAHS